MLFRSLKCLYSLGSFSKTIVYMLQATEYQAGPYLRWFWRTQDFSRVMYRRELHRTKAARLLRSAVVSGIAVQLVLALRCFVLWRWDDFAGGLYFGLALVLSYPLVWAHLVVVPLVLGRVFISAPKQRRQVAQSERIFAAHPGIRIAVAGSYGKTSMKELLVTVLGEQKKVAATPANKNVAISHAQFAAGLAGDEDILVIEYGEGRPGDVAAFARITHLTHGIITGIAPAHLDQYKTLQAAAKDIFSLADYVEAEHVYVNADSETAQSYLRSGMQPYDHTGALGWKAREVMLQPTGTALTLHKGNRRLRLQSGLLGAHQVGPLSLAAALALEFGLSEAQVQAAIARTQPFEHRMQPYQLGGAWIIDDTYNGNIEGIRAGTALLKALPAKRKLYVTPGLVDQGRETQRVHEEMGRLIAAASPDVVVLMQNSVTEYIRSGLEAGGFTGEVRTEPHPLDFYTNLEHQLAAGDLVVMQNDWTDNYK